MYHSNHLHTGREWRISTYLLCANPWGDKNMKEGAKLEVRDKVGTGTYGCEPHISKTDGEIRYQNDQIC